VVTIDHHLEVAYALFTVQIRGILATGWYV